MELRIISIGVLPFHPLWGERTPVRMGHGTTTLIRTEDRLILVDPSLPAPVLTARLQERANVTPGVITDVFLTSFRPEVRRAISLFEGASWWIGEAERESVGLALGSRLKQEAELEDRADKELIEALSQDVGILQRARPAPDQLAPRIGLFPMPGVTPGASGLLIEDARHTTIICGDAIPTVEHLEQGKILPSAFNLDQARESMAEAVEIADLLVLGRDNIVVNPTRRPF